jgi:hypothetical protein
LASDAPYFSQWESPELAQRFIADAAALVEDPRWRRSGARDVAEYARWANHVCGMACVKMILAARTGRAWPIIDLARGAAAYGAYVESDGGIRGLIYAPCVDYLRAVHGIESEVVTGVGAADLPRLMDRAAFFIASVHPAIRMPEREPPRRGGHLVLVTAAEQASVRFHNPSGDAPATSAHVRLDLATFDRFFAGRGIKIAAP